MASQAYSRAASFVPVLTTKVLQYLDLKEDDRILDIGCGDGQLTEKIASRCKEVIGLDSSPSFIKSAKESVAHRCENVVFAEMDCRQLRDAQCSQRLLQESGYEKVFSNAAMHWILADSTIRVAFFRDVHRLLRPGGLFVFEMGGAGNVSEVHAALISVLHFSYQISMERIRAADPWFFPSETWMHQTLSRVGYQVEKVESEYRPTRCMQTSDGGSGLEGWVHLMGAPFLELLSSQQQRDEAARSVCETLHRVVNRPEDGSDWLGYVRLRAVAVKK